MRTTLGKYFVFAALVMATMVGCMKDDFEDINLVGDVTFTAKVNLDTGNGSKQLSENGVKTFAAGEQIAVVYINTSDHTVKATSVALTAGDISNEGKSATFTVTLTDPKAGTTVKYVYPASMVDNNGNETAIANQDGTLESLSSLYDYAYGDGTFDGSALPRLTLTNQFAIGKITMKNYAGSSTLSHIKGATITDGTNTYTITPASDEFSWPIYVAMKPVSSDKTITINATDEGTRDYDTYTKFVTGKTLYAGKMYTLTVKMSRKVDLSHISHYTSGTEYFTSQNGDVLTGTLQEGSYYRQIFIADGDTVTLAGVTINGTNNESYGWAGITCNGDATLILKEGTTNIVRGFQGNYPGIHVLWYNRTLTIMGGGSLNASSNGTGAGIGGSSNQACGNIHIKGGIITATGGEGAAGIGGGENRACGNITISGGNVTATGSGDNYGAGIGGSYNGNCGDITITGGIVLATGANFFGVGIGGGGNASCGDITITSGVSSVTADKGAAATNSIGAGNNGTCGTVTIGGTVYWDGSSYQNGGDDYLTPDLCTYPENVINLATITANYTVPNGKTISGILGANVKISIAAGATVTLRDVTINGINSNRCLWAGINCEGNATLILEGTNKVKGFYEYYPGIQAAHNGTGSGDEYTLTIRGDGSLTASSNGLGAGIGSGRCGYSSGSLTTIDAPCGNINIQGGTITATGGEDGAGIGAATRSSCGNITISGGTITATGGEYASGIGSGRSDFLDMRPSSCGNITISGAHVTATKGGGSPNSIGKGYGASCGTVTIGGTAYPDGISESPYTYEP
ncbi:MAG: hypothetical protein J5677_01415 [Bacteroidales bacterium]|nr:hypothetical protein [Bacteroidales bacterium]